MTDTILTMDTPAADPVDPPAGDPVTPPVSSDPAPADPPASDPPANDPPAPDGADWRARLSGGDDKLLGYLARVPSEKALVERLKRHDDDIKAGKYLKPLPENATAEELAAYRKQYGVPDKPEGYLETLPSGLVVGDDDRPAVDAFLAEMHATNAPKPAVDAALAAYYKIADEQAAAEVERINVAKEESVHALRTEWGADYKRNLNAVDSLIATMPADAAQALMGGTDASGLPIASNPQVIQWLAAIAMEQNPLNTVVPGVGTNQASAVADEIASIKSLMGNRDSKYYKGPEAAKMQERYRQLLEAQEKSQAR